MWVLYCLRQEEGRDSEIGADPQSPAFLPGLESQPWINTCPSQRQIGTAGAWGVWKPLRASAMLPEAKVKVRFSQGLCILFPIKAWPSPACLWPFPGCSMVSLAGLSPHVGFHTLGMHGNSPHWPPPHQPHPSWIPEQGCRALTQNRCQIQTPYGVSC